MAWKTWLEKNMVEMKEPPRKESGCNLGKANRRIGKEHEKAYVRRDLMSPRKGEGRGQ